MSRRYSSLFVAVLFFIGVATAVVIYKEKCKSCSSDDGLSQLKEAFGNNSGIARCPNMLIQKGSRFYLYNSNLNHIPGVNPVSFDTLEEYDEFLKWQRAAGIRCPVLYVQYTYDLNGDPVFKIRPNPNDPQVALPEAPPAIPKGYYEGDINHQTVVDQATSGNYSGDAMDANWGGPDFTKTLMRAGYYD